MKYVIFIRFSVAQTSSFLEEQPGKGHGRRPERTLQANAILRRINGKARAGASPAPTIHEPEKLIRRIVGAIPCGIDSNKIDLMPQLRSLLGLGPLAWLTLALGVASLLTRLQDLWRGRSDPGGIDK